MLKQHYTFYFKSITVLSFVLLLTFLITSFKNNEDTGAFSENNDEAFLPVLSGYNFFKGRISDLRPAKGTELYELTSHLFADYAEKQRLIRIPPGTKMTYQGNGLPEFPDGTILIKTFYYFKNKKELSGGRNIIETRLLIKINSEWKAGTYKWNAEQTEANLISTGSDVEVSWKDTKDIGKNVLFHIPSNKECSECHQSNKADFPIGPKLRNLNFDVSRNGRTINQLRYFQNLGWLDSVNVDSISALPNWENTEYSLETRARAYLDMNCAHCHNGNGSASYKKLYFGYETSFDSTRILLKKEKILARMQSDDIEIKMPSLGTTVIDAEGFELIKQYINGIH